MEYGNKLVLAPWLDKDCLPSTSGALPVPSCFGSIDFVERGTGSVVFGRAMRKRIEWCFRLVLQMSYGLSN
ncbi:hypothetical protein DVH24_009694 [Malus domestica]|uniref:Uncharacterized protein n=1 Tax=Malus domestica TaxID=3750 RepID=A0A498JTH0_MALDO|nr:hypothetical protein DVH24_009694 [Malus domestica]